MKYIFSQVAYKGKMRLFISSVLILTAFMIFSEKFSDMSITLFEFMLLMLSDKFIVLFIFTIIFVLLIPIGSVSSWDMLVLSRMDIKKWHINLSTIIMINAIFYVVLSFLLLFVIGILKNYHIGFTWSGSISTDYIYNIDGFDPAGTPFILLIHNGTSPLLTVIISIMLLIFRCTLFGMISLLITMLTNKQIVGGIAAILIGYFDVFSSNIFGIFKTGLFPYEHSIVTSILEFRMPFGISVMYWIILIGLMVVGGLISADITVEKHITRTRAEGERNE